MSYLQGTVRRTALEARRRRMEVAQVEVMDERWIALPEDLQEKCMPFLPVPDLCRLRAVSKRWAESIDQPAFAAKMKSNATYVLISPDIVYATDGIAWELLDTKSLKHYRISLEYLHPPPQVKVPPKHPEDYYTRRILAADKGLICVLWQYGDHDEAISMENPITRECLKLPLFKRTSVSFSSLNGPCAVMTVADDMTHFRVFVLQEASQDFNIPEANRFSVFDSKVGDWHGLSWPPSRFLHPFHMLKVEKILYTMFRNFTTKRYNLYAYNIDQDVWSCTDVGELDLDYQIPQLVTCSGRLFLTAWEDHDTAQRVTIWEIEVVPSENKLEKCTWMFWKETRCSDVAELIPQFRNPLRSRLHPRSDVPLGSGGVNVQALSSGDGRIIFSSVTGKSVAYHVVTSEWEAVQSGWAISFNVLGLELGPANRGGLFGCVTKLTLCRVPLPAVSVPPNAV